MPLTTHPLPFGLRKIVLFPLDSAGVRIVGGSVALPASRTLSFSEAVDSEDLEAEDGLYASHQGNLHTEWELEGGGVSLAVVRALVGGTITASGTTPNQRNTFTKLKTDERPYFDIEGQVISDSGGDFHAVIYRCKSDESLEVEFDQGSFSMTSTSGKGFGDLVSAKLYDFVQNETTTAIVPA
jgi:hypothetical protein